jgi:hypothetical protein
VPDDSLRVSGDVQVSVFVIGTWLRCRSCQAMYRSSAKAQHTVMSNSSSVSTRTSLSRRRTCLLSCLTRTSPSSSGETTPSSRGGATGASLVAAKTSFLSESSARKCMKVKVMMQQSRNPENESMRTQGAQICDGYCESTVTDSWQTCVCASGCAIVHSLHYFALQSNHSRIPSRRSQR